MRLTAAELLDFAERLRADGLPELEDEDHVLYLVQELRKAAGLRGLETVSLIRQLGIAIDTRKSKKERRREKRGSGLRGDSR